MFTGGGYNLIVSVQDDRPFAVDPGPIGAKGLCPGAAIVLVTGRQRHIVPIGQALEDPAFSGGKKVLFSGKSKIPSVTAWIR